MDVSTVTNFDITVIVIALTTTLFGFWKGFIKQIIGLVGVMGGYFVATRFYIPFLKYLPFKNIDTAKIISFLTIFITILIFASIVGWILYKIIKMLGLEMTNRFVGGILGLLKGFLIVSVISTILVAFLPEKNSFLSNSKTLPYILSGIKKMENIIPNDIKFRFSKKFDSLQNYWLKKELNQQNLKKEIKKIGKLAVK